MMGRPTNKQVLAAARRGLAALASQAINDASVPGMRELVEHYVLGHRRMPAHLLKPGLFDIGLGIPRILTAARTAAIFRLWAGAKVVYAMDGQLLRYLSESSTSRIPTEVLRNLPHPNPYILLPTDTEDDHRSNIGTPLGAIVFGRYDNAARLCSTADERREDLGLMFVTIHTSDEGDILQTLRCTVPLMAGATFTVEDAVAATISQFGFNEDLGEDRAAELEAWLRTHVARIINSLLYVCTDQPDILVESQTGPARKTKKQKVRRARPDDIDTFVKLGFRLGPALGEAQRRREDQQGQGPESAGSGQTQRPHQKRGHYRTYWTGPGGKVPKLRWIAPFWVNKDKLFDSDGPREVVVYPVRKRS